MSAAASPPQPPAFQRPRFHTVPIADVRRETADAVSIAFAIPPSLAEEFRYVPGQYLTLRAELGGQEMRRCYSISSAPDEGEWRVAVKRVDGGVFSAFANERLRAGDVIDLMPPAGRFVLPPASGPRTIAAFAAGSGITPIASQIRTVLMSEPGSRVFLFYGNQTAAGILFREAIDDLKDRFMERFALHNILSREAQDIDALTGRIDAQKVRAFLTHVVPADSLDHALICGPEEFVGEVSEALVASGVPQEAILVERFGSSRRRDRPAAAQIGGGHTIEVTLEGVRRTLPVPAGEPILSAVLAAGLDAPFSCEAGMCCTCRAKVLAGHVKMDVNYALRPEEVAAGFVLTCQAHPVGEGVRLDYDAA